MEALTPAAASRAFKRHFAELTAAFLAPFGRYFQPGLSGMVPRWEPEDFLATLSPDDLHPVLTARLVGAPATAAVALYGAFIASPNFAHWFQQHRQPVLHLVEPEPEEPAVSDVS
eukprot:gene2636-2937_t